MKKAKALFITHDYHQEDNYLPLGTAYVASVLKNQGHNVQVFSQDVFHQSNAELGRFLDCNRFDMIGLGFMAGRYAETIRPLAKTINEHKNGAKLVLGGACVSAIPEYIMEDTGADCAVLGEGEGIMAPLLEGIINGHDVSKLDGVALKTKKGVMVNPRAKPIKHLDKIPFPAWDLFPMENYLTCLRLPGSEPEDKSIMISSSRGCINECSFCYRMEQGLRLRGIDNLLEEMKILNSDYGATYFFFADEMFMPNVKRLRDFSKALNQLEGNIKYWTNFRVGESVKNPEVFKILGDSGCKLLNFGLESLDQNVLNLMGKRARVEDNYRAVELTIEAGIHPGLNFLWGSPGDSFEGLQKIVDFLIEYDTLGQLRTIRPPTPYPGSQLYYRSIRSGELRNAKDFFDKLKNTDRFTVNFTGIPDGEAYPALLEANTKLVRNHFAKRPYLFGEDRIECEEKAEQVIDGFKRVYFPNSEEDLKFRGARHYKK